MFLDLGIFSSSVEPMLTKKLFNDSAISIFEFLFRFDKLFLRVMCLFSLKH